MNEIALGVAISDSCTCHAGRSRQHCAIVAAGREVGGTRLLVDLAPFYDHPRGAVARLEHLYAKHDDLVAIALQEHSQAATLIKPLAEAGIIVVQMSTQDIAVAHGQFMDLVNDGGLAHLDQDPLTAAVRAAQQRPLSGAQAWDSAKVQVDQAPLVAATLACWAFLRWEELSQPGAFVI